MAGGGAIPAFRTKGLLADVLEADGHFDFVGDGADHEVHAEIAAFDGEGGDSAGAVFAAVVLAGTGVGPGEGDGFGLAEHGDVAGDAVGVVAGFLDFFALERDFRVLAGVEEIGAAEVVVAALVVGVDAGGFDGEGDAAVGGVFGVPFDLGVEIVEAAEDVGDVAVFDFEEDVGVDDVGGVGFDGGVRGNRGNGDGGNGESGERDERSDFHNACFGFVDSFDEEAVV